MQEHTHKKDLGTFYHKGPVIINSLLLISMKYFQITFLKYLVQISFFIFYLKLLLKPKKDLHKQYYNL